MPVPYVIAVTGGAGAGKSTAARLLAGQGAVVLDADAYARRVLQDPAVIGELVADFGPGILGQDGAVDRAALASVAFADEAALAVLDARMHPRIASAILADLDALAKEHPQRVVAVLDVPLLTAVPEVLARCDVVVALEAPEAVRTARLALRGLSPQDARRRIAMQPTDAMRRAIADEIVSNDGSTTELEVALAPVWERIRIRAEGR